MKHVLRSYLGRIATTAPPLASRPAQRAGPQKAWPSATELACGDAAQAAVESGDLALMREVLAMLYALPGRWPDPNDRSSAAQTARACNRWGNWLAGKIRLKEQERGGSRVFSLPLSDDEI